VGHEDLYLTNRDLIEGVIRHVARRHVLNTADADDFAGSVRLRLVEDDYRMLRVFQRRSSLRTYLTTVIQRQFLDWQIARWGKWRPSVEAQRAGPIAVLLERLLARDGLSFDEAVETLMTNHRIAVTRDELSALANRLPVRVRRSFVSDEVLTKVAHPAGTAESLLDEAEGQAEGRRTRQLLQKATSELPSQDRLILRMRYEDGFSVVEIARALRLDQKQLYRRLEILLRRLRERLEASGVRGEMAQLILE
jgi:RNA polymerase sigma factor for flagellar operon FliA